MKARLENNIIKKYKNLPSKYKSSTLNIAGGFHLLDTITHEAEGFYDVEFEILDVYETYGDIYFAVDRFIIPAISQLAGFTFNEAKKFIAKNILGRLESILDQYRPLVATLQEANETIPQTLIDLRVDMIIKRQLFITNMTNATTILEVKSIAAQANVYLNNLEVFDYIENKFGI